MTTSHNYTGLKAQIADLFLQTQQPYTDCQAATALNHNRDEVRSALVEMQKDNFLVWTGHVTGFHLKISGEKRE